MVNVVASAALLVFAVRFAKRSLDTVEEHKRKSEEASEKTRRDFKREYKKYP